MPNESLPGVFAEVQNRAFKALVSKGIYALLFPLKEVNGEIIVDTSENLLNGYPVGGFTGSGETVDSEEFQDQLMGGVYKNFVSGAVDPGDIGFTTYFTPAKGKPDLAKVVNSQVFTPQFLLILAVNQDDNTLQGFFSGGVNYAGGNDLKADYGKIISSSFKFKITGEPNWGFAKCGSFPKSMYGSVAYEVAVNDLLQSLHGADPLSDDDDEAFTA